MDFTPLHVRGNIKKAGTAKVSIKMSAKCWNEIYLSIRSYFNLFLKSIFVYIFRFIYNNKLHLFSTCHTYAMRNKFHIE